ncbi:MAG: family 16 glycosylhydrolase [Ghiorsea sp.]
MRVLRFDDKPNIFSWLFSVLVFMLGMMNILINTLKTSFLMLGLLLFLILKSTPAMSASAPAMVSDTMASFDTYTWQKSDAWSNGVPFQVGWRADHVDIYANMLRLRLDDVPCVNNVANCNNEPYASAEVRSKALYGAGQVDFYAQAAQGSGIVTGLFLYTGVSDGYPHDEIDIEFLGKDTTQVQFNYYVGGVGGHEKLIALGFDASQALHQYSIKWGDTEIRWLVDGVEKHRVLATSGAVFPTSPMRIFSNIWASKGVDAWTGVFVYANQPLYAYVDSIAYMAQPMPTSTCDTVKENPSSSSSSTGGGCLTFPALVAPWALLLLLTLLLGRFYRKPT